MERHQFNRLIRPRTMHYPTVGEYVAALRRQVHNVPDNDELTKAQWVQFYTNAANQYQGPHDEEVIDFTLEMLPQIIGSEYYKPLDSLALLAEQCDSQGA